MMGPLSSGSLHSMGTHDSSSSLDWALDAAASKVRPCCSASCHHKPPHWDTLPLPLCRAPVYTCILFHLAAAQPARAIAELVGWQHDLVCKSDCEDYCFERRLWLTQEPFCPAGPGRRGGAGHGEGGAGRGGAHAAARGARLARDARVRSPGRAHPQGRCAGVSRVACSDVLLIHPHMLPRPGSQQSSVCSIIYTTLSFVRSSL